MPAKSKKQEENEEFDRLLKELQTKTKESGEAKAKSHKQSGKAAQDKQTKHKELVEQIKKKGTVDFDRQLERQHQQLQLQRLLESMQMASRPHLSSPKTDITTQVKQSDFFDVATASMQGWRSAMEDAHFSEADFNSADKAGLFCVFDGHAGAKCAQVAKLALPALTKKYYTTAEVANGCNFFSTVYSELDKSLRDKCTDDSGSTAVTVLVTDKYVACANVGDSRAVLCRGGKNFDLSTDHKPESPHERARIESLGGRVEANRVNGQLAMSRALGDYSYKANAEHPPEKQLVIAVPEIVCVPRDASDEFVVLACDGIFDVMSNEEVISFVKAQRKEGKGLQEIASNLCNACLAPQGPDGNPTRAEGTDNMTVTIVAFK